MNGRSLTYDQIQSCQEIQVWLSQFGGNRLVAIELLMRLRIVSRDEYGEWLKKRILTEAKGNTGLFAGRRTVQRNANDTRVSLAYDAASQNTLVFHRKSAGTSILQLDYRYDDAGNRTEMIEDAGSARTTWSYDNSNQLTGENRAGTNAYRQTFTYDPAGNRLLKNIDGARTTYAYNAANELKYGQAASGRTTYLYDLTGNQQIEQPPAGNRTTTTWNFENQPTQYLLPVGDPVTMAYNGDNRRVLKQQDTDITKFVWDSVADAYVAELDGSDVVIATYTNEPQYFGGVLTQRRNAVTTILHADVLGTTRVITSSTEAVTGLYLFDAWGTEITSSTSIVIPFTWVGFYGYYEDFETGMLYVRARTYSSVIALWTSADPLGPLIAPKLYSICWNAPSVHVDPSGLSPQPHQIVSAVSACTDTLLNAAHIALIQNSTLAQPIKELIGAFPVLSAILLNSYRHWAGINTEGTNGFVFTCRCGWIDLGHFWAGALGGFLRDARWSYFLGFLVELVQRYGPGDEGWVGSQFTIEDLPSDLMGARFGELMKGKTIADLPREFCQLLNDCNPPKVDAGSLRILQEEATSLSDEKTNVWPTSPWDLPQPWRGEAHKLLCCSTEPYNPEREV